MSVKGRNFLHTICRLEIIIEENVKTKQNRHVLFILNLVLKNVRFYKYLYSLVELFINMNSYMQSPSVARYIHAATRMKDEMKDCVDSGLY
jgi:hypothetical protein